MVAMEGPRDFNSEDSSVAKKRVGEEGIKDDCFSTPDLEDTMTDMADGSTEETPCEDDLTDYEGEGGKSLDSHLKNMDGWGKLGESEKYKNRGTIEFKDGNYERALKYYKRAVSCIKHLEEEKTKKTDEEEASEQASKEASEGASKEGSEGASKEGSEEGSKDVKKNELKISCQLNISMCHLKLNEWTAAIKACDLVLELSPGNTKALYRRGVGKSNFGFYSEAREDLLEVLRLDPDNTEAKRELHSLKQRILQHKQSNKKAFGSLFAGGMSLYEDREAERQELLKKEEEERKAKRERWHKEMDMRRDKGEEETSFDEWCAEEDKKRKADLEAEEKERVEKQKKHVSEPIKTSSSKSASDDVLDEEDQQILNETKKMGYCYFRRDLSEEEKRINALNKPRRLDEQADLSEPAGAASGASEADGTLDSRSPPPRALSSWNAQGTTYEEKDMSSWCLEKFSQKLRLSKASRKNDLNDPARLQALLQDMMPPGGSPDKDPMGMIRRMAASMYSMEVTCTEVKDVGGEGHVSVVRGTKRYLFDLHATMKWKLSLEMPSLGPGMPPLHSPDDKTSTVYIGELVIRDVSSALPSESNWLSDSTLSCDQKIKPDHQECFDSIMGEFKKHVIQQIDSFLEEYRAAA